MSDESRPGPPSCADLPADKTESLNSAIEELEEVLNERRVLEEGAPADAPPPSEPPPRGEQYSIPLLHEVVTPRRAREPGPAPDPVQAEAQRYRPIIERLTSEIEVIVQTGVDEALKSASRDILRKVNEHIEIVLPEILDELSHLDRDDEG